MLFLLAISLSPCRAEVVDVAVASNFTDTLRKLAPLFRQSTGHELRISSASTGKLYAQIYHGAPYDLFLAADSARPKRLVEEGLALKGSRFTFALGRLVLWSPKDRFQQTGPELLQNHTFRRLAIANPKTAPYGAAAQQVLKAMGLWDQLRGRLARGENIGQTFQFVASSAADIGFVALSQVRSMPSVGDGYQWQVPDDLYQPIRQQAVLLNRGRDKESAHSFLLFLRGADAVALIRDSGYGIEGDGQ
jgi:molybdate transport system substrate-binding protein